MEVKVCYDLMCARVLGHWTWEMKKQRWPWLEVSLPDYFMSVFKCAHTRPCWWLRRSFAARGYINTAGQGQFITFIVWVKAVSVGVDNQASPGYPQVDFCFASVDLSEFVCACLRSWPSWRIRDGEERSPTCARGWGQGSSYTNTPSEIECKSASGAVGPLDYHYHAQHHILHTLSVSLSLVGALKFHQQLI